MIDWQSYIDGTMPPAESAALSKRLEAEPNLNAELEGYKAFIAEIAAQGQAVSAPMGRLHDTMDMVVGSPKPKARPWWLRPGLAMAVVILIIIVAFNRNHDPMSLARTPMLGTTQQPTPEYAAAWLTARSGLEIPIMDVKVPGLQLVAASYGVGWASMEYKFEGQKLTLYMADRKESGQAPVLYVSDQGTAWQGTTIAYYLTGPRAARDKVVDYMIQRSRHARHPGSAAIEDCRI